MEYPASWQHNKLIFEGMLKFYWHNGVYSTELLDQLWSARPTGATGYPIGEQQIQRVIRNAVTREWKRPWIEISRDWVIIAKQKRLAPLMAPFELACQGLLAPVDSRHLVRSWQFRYAASLPRRPVEQITEDRAIWNALVSNLMSDPDQRRTRRIPTDVPPITIEEILKG